MSGRIPAGEGRVSVDYYDRRSTQQERKKTSSPRIHPSVQLRSPVPPGNCFTKERRHMNIYEEAEVVNGPPGFMQWNAKRESNRYILSAGKYKDKAVYHCKKMNRLLEALVESRWYRREVTRMQLCLIGHLNDGWIAKCKRYSHQFTIPYRHCIIIQRSLKYVSN